MAQKIAAQKELPPITAALVIETIGLEIERDRTSAEFCADMIVGARRKKIGLAGVGRVPPQFRAIEAARDGARTLLAEMCRVCPHAECPMKRW